MFDEDYVWFKSEKDGSNFCINRSQIIEARIIQIVPHAFMIYVKLNLFYKFEDQKIAECKTTLEDAKEIVKQFLETPKKSVKEITERFLEKEIKPVTKKKPKAAPKKKKEEI